MIFALRLGTGYQQAPFNQLLNSLIICIVSTLALVLSTDFTFHQIPSFWLQPKYSKLKLFQTWSSSANIFQNLKTKELFSQLHFSAAVALDTLQWKYLNLEYNSGLTTREPFDFHWEKGDSKTVSCLWDCPENRTRMMGRKAIYYQQHPLQNEIVFMILFLTVCIFEHRTCLLFCYFF